MDDLELRQKLYAIGAALLAIAVDLRDVKAETTGITKAFHDVNAHLAAIRADAYLASEQYKTLGVEYAGLELRLANLEHYTRTMMAKP